MVHTGAQQYPGTSLCLHSLLLGHGMSTCGVPLVLPLSRRGIFVSQAVRNLTFGSICCLHPSPMSHACFKNLLFLSKLYLAGQVLRTWSFRRGNSCRRAQRGGRADSGVPAAAVSFHFFLLSLLQGCPFSWQEGLLGTNCLYSALRGLWLRILGEFQLVKGI